MAVQLSYFWSNHLLFIFIVLCYHYQLSRIQNLLSLVWSQRYDKGSFSGSPCCANDDTVISRGLLCTWGSDWITGWVGWGWWVVLVQTLLILFLLDSLSLPLSQRNPIGCLWAPGPEDILSIIDHFCRYALDTVSKKIRSIWQTWSRVQSSFIIAGAC